MKAYYSLFKMRLLNGFQYRVAAIAGMSTQFFWGFMYIMIFEAFYKSTTATQQISFQEIVQVLWLQQGLLMLVVLWFRDNDIGKLITGGNIVYELCRPLSLYHYWYTKLISERISAALLRCIPLFLVASLLPPPYNLTLPDSFLRFTLFLVTLILGLILLVALSMLTYISVFYTMNLYGSILIFGVFGEFFAGLIIPVPLMPEPLKTIVYFLPFRYTSDLPFRIYAGNIDIKEAILSIGVQILYILILFTLGKLWMKKALRRVVIQGG